MQNTSTPPFFIVGAPRSGTTLLQSALSSHSDLVIPPEEDLILKFYAQFGREAYRLSDADIEQFVTVLFEEVQSIRFWQIDRQDLARRLTALDDRSFRNTIEATYGEFMSRFPEKIRWGCKAPHYVLQMDKVNAVFPDAKFLHIVRDPRAVHASMAARARRGDKYFTESPWRNSWQWKTWVQSGLSWSQKFPGRCMELRYEQLVGRPEETLASVCDFLNITFEAQLLSHYENTTERELIRTDNIDRYLKRGFKDERIDAWKEDCTSRELRIIEELAGDMMLELDYTQHQDSKSRPHASTLALYRIWRSSGDSMRSALLRLRYRYRNSLRPRWTCH